ncbi:MAG: Com family DNA-binding transcriptional regulator [bacterium]
MKDFRCKFCNRLLAKVTEASMVEIKCPKCKSLNLYQNDIVSVVGVNEAYMQKHGLRPFHPKANYAQ